jgi:hypothetical protein
MARVRGRGGGGALRCPRTRAARVPLSRRVAAVAAAAARCLAAARCWPCASDARKASPHAHASAAPPSPCGSAGSAGSAGSGGSAESEESSGAASAVAAATASRACVARRGACARAARVSARQPRTHARRECRIMCMREQSAPRPRRRPRQLRSADGVRGRVRGARGRGRAHAAALPWRCRRGAPCLRSSL